MSSKGISMKRKHADLFQLTNNSGNSTTWVEEFYPKNIEELAVHKKKVSEVHLWIQNATSQNNKDAVIALFTGPPGVGKTASAETVCRYLGIEVFTWSNKQQEYTNNDVFYNSRDGMGETQAESFSRFLLQSSKYSLYSDSKRIIMVEEFPNAFIKEPAIFHAIIRRYGAVRSHQPLLFIISENARGESLENRLFPKDMQAALRIQNISFNPVSPTMIMKALTKINNSSKVSSRKLSKAELEGIAADCAGDIRNAIHSMQFMCMSHFRKPVCPSTKSSSKRDSSLFLFHALGKILYCKRDDSSKKCSHDVLPTHLKKFEKDPLVSNPEEVFECTSISADAFSLFLQENYPPFVEEDIEANYECAKWLSEADHLTASWSCREMMTGYSVSVASRGLMFNLTPGAMSRRWRALHKPRHYDNNSKRRRLEISLKNAFKGTSLSMRELQIDFIPYSLKLQGKDFNPNQTALLKELGDMKVKKVIREKTLGEKDHFELEADESGAVGTDAGPRLDSWTPGDDEEINIEEYDF